MQEKRCAFDVEHSFRKKDNLFFNWIQLLEGFLCIIVDIFRVDMTQQNRLRVRCSAVHCWILFIMMNIMDIVCIEFECRENIEYIDTKRNIIVIFQIYKFTTMHNCAYMSHIIISKNLIIKNVGAIINTLRIIILLNMQCDMTGKSFFLYDYYSCRQVPHAMTHYV